MPRRLPPGSNRKIETSEDKAWQEWFDKLDIKEHGQYLSKLGLDKGEIEEWESTGGFKKPDKKKD